MGQVVLDAQRSSVHGKESREFAGDAFGGIVCPDDGEDGLLCELIAGGGNAAGGEQSVGLGGHFRGVLAFDVEHGRHMVRKRVTVDADGRAKGAVQVWPVGQPIRVRAQEAFDVLGGGIARVGAGEFTVGKGHRREG